MRDPYDRRTILKTIGAGSITPAIAGCTSDGNGDGNGDGEETPTPTPEDTNGEPDHEVPHPNNDELSDAEATGEPLAGGERQPGNQSEPDNASVMLQHTPSDGQSCGSCALYVPDQNDDGFGACSSVAGKIHPCDWCLLYSEYSGDDWENPCETV
ncbi:high-potential iron-sulfur protein [Halopenitus sp. H-Gu1]|uniref:high-potential iron-sulfur protein n=1 Tax=Halopenitus sp. H-Gu1 TaxID=3242697 RepID=UPI00359E4E3D